MSLSDFHELHVTELQYLAMNILRQLYKLVQPYRSKIILVTFFLLISTAIDMAMPTILQQVIDVGLIAGETHLLLLRCAGRCRAWIGKNVPDSPANLPDTLDLTANRI